MIRRLVKGATLGFVAARILPAALTETANTVAMLLAARILLTTFIGLAPVLLIAQRALRPASPPVLELEL